MAEKSAIAHQPVISIRISEALRMRLEALKVLMSIRLAKPSPHLRPRSNCLSPRKRTVLSW